MLRFGVDKPLFYMSAQKMKSGGKVAPKLDLNSVYTSASEPWALPSELYEDVEQAAHVSVD